jgi:predicted dehydrogenase
MSDRICATGGRDATTARPPRPRRRQEAACCADLSHELDYLLWLYGPWHRVAALGGSSGARQVDVDDHLDLLLEMARSQTVHVHMDYLDRSGIRKIRMNLPEETIEADILGGRLTINGKSP